MGLFGSVQLNEEEKEEIKQIKLNSKLRKKAQKAALRAEKARRKAEGLRAKEKTQIEEGGQRLKEEVEEVNNISLPATIEGVDDLRSSLRDKSDNRAHIATQNSTINDDPSFGLNATAKSRAQLWDKKIAEKNEEAAAAAQIDNILVAKRQGRKSHFADEGPAPIPVNRRSTAEKENDAPHVVPSGKVASAYKELVREEESNSARQGKQDFAKINVDLKGIKSSFSEAGTDHMPESTTTAKRSKAADALRKKKSTPGQGYNIATARVSGLQEYTQIKVIGKGSWGDVALCQKDSQNVVLKRIPLEKCGRYFDGNGCQTTKEIQLQEEAMHCCVVQIFSFFSEARFLYISLEYLDGGDLKHWATAHNKDSPSQLEKKIVKFTTQMLLGLKAVHDQCIIHRDVKLHNFFLSSGGVVKLGDFGFATRTKGSYIKSTNPNVPDEQERMMYTQQGTPYYLAPEQCAGENYNSKVDIWACGCSIYELFHDCPPFDAGNGSNLVLKILRAKVDAPIEGISNSFSKVVAACLQRNPERRPSAEEILLSPCIIGEISTYLDSERLQLDFPGHYKKIQEGKGSDLIRGFETTTWAHLSDGEQKITYADPFAPSVSRDMNAITLPGKYGTGAGYKGSLNSEGRWHGRGLAVYPNGTKYDGEWKDDQWHGNGIITEADGTSWECVFVKDKRQPGGTKINSGQQSSAPPMSAQEDEFCNE